MINIFLISYILNILGGLSVLYLLYKNLKLEIKLKEREEDYWNSCYEQNERE